MHTTRSAIKEMESTGVRDRLWHVSIATATSTQRIKIEEAGFT